MDRELSIIKKHQMRGLGLSVAVDELGGALCSFLPIGVGTHRMCDLGLRGGQKWSLGGALRGFLRLDLRTHLSRDPSIRGSQ